jgi:hypothetical protein
MSGRKQHFIPQSLLRGFGRVGKGAKAQVVAYTFDRGIFTAATDGVGAERNFYSEYGVVGEEQSLDDKITNFETPLADVLASFRSQPNGACVDVSEAATFVTHLTIRNDHFRKSISSGGAAMFDGLQRAMMDEDTARAMLGIAGDRPTAVFSDAMQNLLKEHAAMFALLGLSDEQVIEWAFGYAKANYSQFHNELIAPMNAVFGGFTEERILEVAADAQRRSLNSDLSPQAWIERLSNMSWSVLHSGNPLILPDCVSVAFDEERNACPLMLEERENVRSICVPIASDRLLLGQTMQSEFTGQGLNAAFAACSWDFFIAEERNSGYEALRSTIRANVGRIMNELISDALNESVQKQSGE